MPEMIAAAGVQVALGGRKRRQQILRGVDFAAGDGQVVGICGANGVGKSTMLRVLAGFLPAEAGQVTLLGRPLQEIPLKQRARQFAFMHQETTLNFDFTVREVVEMGRFPYRAAMAAPGAADREVVDQALGRTGCLDIAGQHFLSLSGGERQRVLLARTMAQQAPLWLLDEPTASLDVSFSQRLYALAGEHAGGGGAVVMAMHDLRAAATACTHIALLHEGRVIAMGQPWQVLTEENLSLAYGVRAIPFQNPAGQWDYYLA